MKRSFILLVFMTAVLCMTAQMARQSVGFEQKSSQQHLKTHAPIAQKYAELLKRVEKTTAPAQTRGNDWWEPDTIVSDRGEYDGMGREIFSYNAQGLVASRLFQMQNGRSWENFFRYAYTYDASDNLLSELWQMWENNSWKNVMQDVYTYDGYNNMETSLSQYWDDSAWMNSWYGIFTYDENNNLLTEMWQIWVDDDWENNMQTTYTYNEYNNPLTETDQLWNEAWINDYLYTYSYSGNKPMHILGQMWEDDDWVNDYQADATYDGENVAQVIFQAWDGEQWENDERLSFSYENNNLTKELLEGWTVTNTWEPYYETTYTYDSNNNQTEIVSQYYDWDEEAWIPEYKTTRQYDANNNAHTVENWIWENQWEPDANDCSFFYNNMQSEMWTYAQIATISYIKVNNPNAINDPAQEIAVSVFPNPTSGELRIEMCDMRYEICDIQIFDTFGRKLQVSNLKSQISNPQINIAHLPAGIYFVRIQTENGVVVRKVVKN